MCKSGALATQINFNEPHSPDMKSFGTVPRFRDVSTADGPARGWPAGVSSSYYGCASPPDSEYIHSSVIAAKQVLTLHFQRDIARDLWVYWIFANLINEKSGVFVAPEFSRQSL